MYNEQPLKAKTSNINVGDTERWASVVGGALLARSGLRRSSLKGLFLTLLGGTLIYRGVTGHCDVYEVLGISTGRRTQSPVASVFHKEGIKVEKSITVNRSPEELYRFWRNFENLPHFMEHLESVRRIDDKRSHWIARAPMGRTVEWEAEVYIEYTPIAGTNRTW